MKISDFIEPENISEEENSEGVNLEEVIKTAELLEAFSEEDTLLDDLAKLAVLQDIIGTNKKYLESIGNK